jgi:hypothetical protein
MVRSRRREATYRGDCYLIDEGEQEAFTLLSVTAGRFNNRAA